MGVAGDGNVAAQSFGSVGNILLDIHAAILDESLIDQAVLLVELAQLANGHLFLDGVRLVGVLGIVRHLSQDDLLFLGNGLGRDGSFVQVAGVGSRDLHGDVLAESGKLGLGSHVVAGLELDDDAVRAAAVHIGSAVAFITGKTADLDVLLDDQDQGLQGIVHSAVAHLAAHQGLHVGGILVSDNTGQVLGEFHELLVLGNEVGLGVDLDHDGAVRERNRVDHTLGSNAASLLAGGGQALLAQDLNGLLEIALRLGQSLLAFHHAAVGLAAQFHNVFCRNSHVSIVLSVLYACMLAIRLRRSPQQGRRVLPERPACLPARRSPWRRRSA